MRYEVPVIKLTRATVPVGGTGGAVVGDLTYGHVIRNDFRTLLHVFNTSGAARTVTVRFPSGSDPDGCVVNDKTLSIPSGSDIQALLGPFPDNWSEVNGYQALTNGNMDAWTSGTDLTSWAESIGDGAVEQVTQAGLTLYGKGSACRLRRTSSGGGGIAVQTESGVRFHLPEGKQCVAEGWARREGVTPARLGVLMLDALPSPDQYLAPDGVTWSTTLQDVATFNLTEEWQQFRVPFYPQVTQSGQYGLQLAERTGNIGARILLDDWRVGLVDPPVGVQFDLSGSGLYLRAYRLP